jgi:predicted lipoprotein with Yx(FWY)xxD motif
MKTFLILLIATLAFAAARPSCDAVCTDSTCVGKLSDSLDDLTKYVASVAAVVRALAPTTTTTTAAPVTTTTAAPTTHHVDSASGTKSVTTSPAGGHSTDKSAGDEFADFPLDRDIAFYQRECRRTPANLLACSPLARKLKKDDNFAIAEAARLGFTLTFPKKSSKAANDYVITALPQESALLKQLETLKEERAKADAGKSAAQAAADREAQIQAEVAAKAKAAKDAADAAAAKAAADAAAAAEAAAKAQGLSEAEAKAAADKAAADAKAKADADAAAAAAAAKAQADKEAADRAAAAAAAAAAAPKIKLGNTPAGQSLVDPSGRTLYFNTDPSDFCVDACKPHWPHLAPEVASAGAAGVTCVFGTAVRPDGGVQVTANGKPLFFSDKDVGPGTSNGNNDGNGFVIAKC